MTVVPADLLSVSLVLALDNALCISLKNAVFAASLGSLALEVFKLSFGFISSISLLTPSISVKSLLILESDY